MSVSFGNRVNKTNESPAITSPRETIPAHEKIGTIYAKAVDALKPDSPYQIAPLLKDLGIDPSDKDAVSEMCSLLTQLDDDTLQVSPLASGIFLLKKKDPTGLTNEYKEIAVFKVGHKRAAMESSARYLAHLLGLNKHMISGMYCTMYNLPLYQLVEGEDTTEDLWNGNQKIFEQNKPAQKNETKSLTPPFQFDFDEGEELADHSLETTGEKKNSASASSDFTLTGDETVSNKSNSSDFSRTEEEISWDKSDASGSLLQAAQDKSDSFDETPAKKALPPADHPSYNTACAVVGVVQPYLFKKEEADLFEFTKMTIAALAIGLRDGKNDGFIGSTLFDIEDNFPIRIDPVFVNGRMTTSCAIDLPYLDKDERTKQSLTLEEVRELHQLVANWNLCDILKKMGRLEIRYMDTICEETDAGSSGKDEGNYETTIVEGVDHAINGKLNALQDNLKRRVLRADQLNAMNTRLNRICDFIVKNSLEETTFSPEELVDAVDIAGKIYKDKIEAATNSLPLSLQSTLKTSGPHHITGRTSPTMVITENEVTGGKTRAALQTGRIAAPTPFRSLPIQMNGFSPGSPEGLGISISPIDGLDLPLFTGNIKERFTNSPNENNPFLFNESPTGSPSFLDLTLPSSEGEENNTLLSFNED